MRKIHVAMIVILIVIIFAIAGVFIFKNREVEDIDEWINEPGDEDFTEMIFDDVSENHPFVEYIVFLNQREIMTVSSDGKFYPDNFVSMKEFIEIIFRASMGRLDFEKLKDEDFIRILEENKIIKSGEITLENLNNNVTNYQVAVLLAKVDMKIRNHEQVIADLRYTDIKGVDEVGQTLIAHCVGRGFFKHDTNFYPDKTLTRAELAELIYLFVNK